MFALEFDIQDDRPSTWNECWGSLWLWAEGHLVGAPYETEMIQTGLDSLWEVAMENRIPASSILSARSSKEALDAVMWARYGGADHPPVQLTATNEESLASLEVLPRRGGPFFDGWEAILVAEGDSERFVFREEGREVTLAVWPEGTFTRVVGEAKSEFEKLARSMAGGPDDKF